MAKVSEEIKRKRSGQVEFRIRKERDMYARTTRLQNYAERTGNCPYCKRPRAHAVTCGSKRCIGRFLMIDTGQTEDDVVGESD